MERNCDHCGTSYQAVKSTSKFCSSKCRAKASITNRAKNLGEIKITTEPEKQREKVEIPKMGITDPAALFIIAQWERNYNRLEKDYDSERQAKKELKKTNAELKDKIARIEVEQKIASIEGKKPTGLNGFLESEAGAQAMQIFGPVLAKIAERTLEQAPQVAGLPAGGEGTFMNQFHQWLGNQPGDIQQYVGELLAAFMQVPDQLNLMQRLLQTRNLIMGDFMKRSA